MPKKKKPIVITGGSKNPIIYSPSPGIIHFEELSITGGSMRECLAAMNDSFIHTTNVSPLNN